MIFFKKKNKGKGKGKEKGTGQRKIFFEDTNLGQLEQAIKVVVAGLKHLPVGHNLRLRQLNKLSKVRQRICAFCASTQRNQMKRERERERERERQQSIRT